MNINNTLDLSLSTQYDLIVDRGRDLNCTIDCTYLSGTTEVPFSFTSFSDAQLTIKNEYGTIMMAFNTSDGSLILNTSSFTLIKSDSEMLIPRAGNYLYDMYLVDTIGKRGFLRGTITFIQNISI